MAIPPVFDESMNSNANRLVRALSDETESSLIPDAEFDIGRPGRRFCLYPGHLGYDLQDELNFLANRRWNRTCSSPAIFWRRPSRALTTGK